MTGLNYTSREKQVHKLMTGGLSNDETLQLPVDLCTTFVKEYHQSLKIMKLNKKMIIIIMKHLNIPVAIEAIQVTYCLYN